MDVLAAGRAPLSPELLNLLWRQAEAGSASAAKTLLAAQIGGVDIGSSPGVDAADLPDPRESERICIEITRRVTKLAAEQIEQADYCPSCQRELDDDTRAAMVERIKPEAQPKEAMTEEEAEQMRALWMRWQAHLTDPQNSPKPTEPCPNPQHHPSVFPEIFDLTK